MFILKTKAAQESYPEPLLVAASEALGGVQDDEAELVFHTLDIVKNFIDKYTIQSIVEDENEERLIIERTGANLMFVKEDIEEAEVFVVKEEEYENEADDYNALDDSIDDEIEQIDGDENVEEEEEESIKEESISMATDMSATESFMFHNVEFVERTPEYIINAYKPSEKPSRPKDPDNWIRNKQRNARLRGEEYVAANGKSVPGKRMRSPCKETCRYKCRKKISEEDRQKNFDKYWEFASFILQRKFIFEHHKTVPIQRRRFRTATGGKPREYSSQYSLDKYKIDGTVEQVQVCESMFLKTFDICRNIVAYLHKKVQTGKVQDLRGINRRKLSPGHEAAIEQIKSYPFYHIEQPMPITKLFEIYQEHCAKKGIEPVRNHTYRKLFAEYNECEFLKRDKVICEVCDSYYRSDDEEKRLMLHKYNDHINSNEKCSQRAKGRVRSARKVDRRKALRLEKNLLAQNLQDQHNEAADDDMIVEEHLSYDNDGIEYS